MQDLNKLTKKQLIEIIEKKETPSKAALKAFNGDSEASLLIREALVSAIEEIKEKGLKLERPHFARYEKTSSRTLRHKRDDFYIMDKRADLQVGLQHLSILIEKEVARLS